MDADFVYISKSEEDTAKLAESLASIAKIGDVFALFGTLGMGKSVLARAFVQKLSGAKEVPSPTFTLVQGYDTPDFEINHYDLYRLKSPEEIFEIGMEDAMYQSVSLIEWPEMMGGYLPRNIFKIQITPCEEGRKISISAGSDEKKQRLKTLGDL